MTDQMPAQHEIATREAMDATISAWPVLPNPDPVLKAMGKDISVYRALLADSVVNGLRSRRIAAVCAFNARFAPSASFISPNVAHACATLIRSIGVRQLVHTFIDGAFYGYRVVELIWGAKDGLLVPELRAKPCDWFCFGPAGELRFRRAGVPVAEAVPPEKFVVVGKMQTWETPYGEPDLAACFWPVVFKSMGLKLWATFTEKYGTPWAIGKLPRTASPEETEALAEKLAAMVRDAVLVIPDEGSVKLLAPGTAANAALYERLVRFCRSEIAIALLGSNRTVEVNDGALAALEVEADLAQDDAQMIAAGINQVLRRFCAVNFPGEVLPAFEFVNERLRDAARCRRDEVLRRAGCPPFTKQYFEREYNLKGSDLANS